METYQNMVPTEGTSLLSPTGETTHRSSSSRRRSWMKSLFKAAVPLAAAVFVIMGVSILATSLGFDFNHKMMMQLRGGEVNLLGAVETSVDGFPTLSPTLSPVRPTGLPTVSPTLSPTVSPTVSPTLSPTVSPTTPVKR